MKRAQNGRLRVHEKRARKHQGKGEKLSLRKFRAPLSLIFFGTSPKQREQNRSHHASDIFVPPRNIPIPSSFHTTVHYARILPFSVECRRSTAYYKAPRIVLKPCKTIEQKREEEKGLSGFAFRGAARVCPAFGARRTPRGNARGRGRLVARVPRGFSVWCPTSLT